MYTLNSCINTYLARLNSAHPNSGQSKAFKKAQKQSATAHCVKFLEVYNNQIIFEKALTEQFETTGNMANSINEISNCIIGALGENEHQ